MNKTCLKIMLGFHAIFIVMVVFLFYFFSSKDYELVNYPPTGVVTVAFGDSLITGYGATQGNDFVSLLSKKLGIPIINEGMNGDTTESALKRLDDDVFPHNPNVVIILLGGNDALQQLDINETFENLREIVRRIQKRGAFIILLGVRDGLFFDSYAGRFEDLAIEMGALYVPDVLKNLLGDSVYMYDTIHPNDKGNEVIGDRIYKIIWPFIQNGRY